MQVQYQKKMIILLLQLVKRKQFNIPVVILSFEGTGYRTS